MSAPISFEEYLDRLENYFESGKNSDTEKVHMEKMFLFAITAFESGKPIAITLTDKTEIKYAKVINYSKSSFTIEWIDGRRIPDATSTYNERYIEQVNRLSLGYQLITKYSFL